MFKAGDLVLLNPSSANKHWGHIAYDIYRKGGVERVYKVKRTSRYSSLFTCVLWDVVKNRRKGSWAYAIYAEDLVPFGFNLDGNIEDWA